MFDITLFDLLYVLVACLFLMHAEDIAEMALDTIARIVGYRKLACVECGGGFDPPSGIEETFCSTACFVDSYDAAYKQYRASRKRRNERLDDAFLLSEDPLVATTPDRCSDAASHAARLHAGVDCTCDFEQIREEYQQRRLAEGHRVIILDEEPTTITIGGEGGWMVHAGGPEAEAY